MSDWRKRRTASVEEHEGWADGRSIRSALEDAAERVRRRRAVLNSVLVAFLVGAPLVAFFLGGPH